MAEMEMEREMEREDTQEARKIVVSPFTHMKAHEVCRSHWGFIQPVDGMRFGRVGFVGARYGLRGVRVGEACRPGRCYDQGV